MSTTESFSDANNSGRTFNRLDATYQKFPDTIRALANVVWHTLEHYEQVRLIHLAVEEFGAADPKRQDKFINHYMFADYINDSQANTEWQARSKRGLYY